MPGGKRKHIVVLIITIAYMVFFYNNCLIIPYSPEKNKSVSFTFFIYTPSKDVVKAEKKQKKHNDAIEDTFALHFIVPEKNEGTQAGSENQSCSSGKVVPPPGDDIGDNKIPCDGGETSRVSGTGRQGNTKMLLTANKVIKALADLNWQDKLWLLKILSRCSMDELLQIRSMLKDGVTWEENKVMFTMLRKKVTDEEQKKLDSLIEAYTR